MEEARLSYLLSKPTLLGLDLATPLALLLLAAVVVFWRLPLTRDRRVAKLRILAYVSLVLGIAGLQLTSSLPADELTVVAAVDVSGSMSAQAIEWARQTVRDVAASLPPGDRMAVVGFAGKAELVSPPAHEVAVDTLERPPRPAATNIAAAIDHALTLFPADKQKALLVLSDGNETIGQARGRIATLRALGARVYTAAPPPDDGLDVRITKIIAPALTGPERPVPLRIVVRNPRGTRHGVLNLYLDSLLSDSRAVELAPGLNTFDLLLRPPDAGGHVIRAQIAVEDDRAPENNQRELTLNVRPRTRVLLATKRRHSALQDTLIERGFSLSRISPGDLPTEDAGYATTHLVVLEDVRASFVDERAIHALANFVGTRGGGLLFAGGGLSFGDEKWSDTSMEDLLPVTLEPRRPKPGKREPLALFLIVDRSNSMGFNSRISTVRDGEKLRYAIKASVAVIRQLKDHDQVGVIAFDARPHEIAPLRPLRENRKRLLRALPRLVESGGTDFFDALHDAAEQLQRSRVNRKHVVLLTDGDTNRASRGEYRDLIEKLGADGISVTTIRIGDNTVNLKLLQDISNGTKGSFHHVADVKMLPDLMLRDTTRALKPLTPKDERFFPALAAEHRLLSEVREDEIPYVVDYAFAKAKATSETLLHVARAERRDPILSVWRYGLGRVAAFTASPADDAETWPSWQGYARFWSQLAFWAARIASDHDVSTRALRHEESTEIVVRGFRHATPASYPSGRLWADDPPLALSFTMDETGNHRAHLPPIAPGRYRLTLVERSPSGGAREISTYTAVPTEHAESAREYSGAGTNEDLLRELARRTGGAANATARDILERPAGERRVAYPLTHILVPLAMLAFFADIALRRRPASL